MDDRDLYGRAGRSQGAGAYGAAPRRGGGGLLLVLLAFACGIALAAYAVHRWDRLASLLHPAPTQPAPPSATRLVTPPVQPIAAPVATGADPALLDKVEARDDRVDQLGAETREASGDADRAEGLLVAFAARRAVDRGQPLGYIEGLLQNHFGKDQGPAVAMIVGAAQRPVTLLQLQNQFAELAPSLVVTGPGESWWTGVRRELGSIFVVRKTVTPSIEPSAQRDRAVRALDQGAVEEAMAEVLRMPGASRANGWVAEARRYVLAHNALDRIEAAALLQPNRPVATASAPTPAPTIVPVVPAIAAKHP